MRNHISAAILAVSLGACAGREAVAPAPVANGNEQVMTCASLHAEMTANNTRIAGLMQEEQSKRGQNIAMGVIGVVLFWPALFAMDFKDGAGTDRKNAEVRQQYLLSIYSQRSCSNAS